MLARNSDGEPQVLTNLASEKCEAPRPSQVAALLAALLDWSHRANRRVTGRVRGPAGIDARLDLARQVELELFVQFSIGGRAPNERPDGGDDSTTPGRHGALLSDGSDDRCHCLRQPLPVGGLLGNSPTTGTRQRVIPGPAVGFRQLPLGPDPAITFELVQ